MKVNVALGRTYKWTLPIDPRLHVRRPSENIMDRPTWPYGALGGSVAGLRLILVLLTQIPASVHACCHKQLSVWLGSSLTQRPSLFAKNRVRLNFHPGFLYLAFTLGRGGILQHWIVFQGTPRSDAVLDMI